MGGPGLMRILGPAHSMPKVDFPTDKKILVDVEAYHQLLSRACYNEPDRFDPVVFVKNTLLKIIKGHDVEFFFNGDGNAEKVKTVMQCLDKAAPLDSVEAPIVTMEQLSHTDYSWNISGLGIGNNNRILKSISNDNDTLQTLLQSYNVHPEVQIALARYHTEDQATRSAKPLNQAASVRAFVDGNETPLTTMERNTKRLQEHMNAERVRQLKDRRLRASGTRRRASKR
ncbi:hypothetical protein BGX24_008987 [Mortierella sp. AD032]|nr:hypothetical protein BGX24_008987 [Mortierella sp. AD032]